MIRFNAIYFADAFADAWLLAVPHIFGGANLRKFSGGMTIGEIIKDHPHLTREDIYYAQAFAADYLAYEQIAFG